MIISTEIATVIAGLLIFAGTCFVAWMRKRDTLLTQSINLVELYDDKFRKYDKDNDCEGALSALEQLLMYRKKGAMDKQVFYCAYSATMKKFAQNEGALKFMMNERVKHPDEELFDYIFDYWKDERIDIKKVDVDSTKLSD